MLYFLISFSMFARNVDKKDILNLKKTIKVNSISYFREKEENINYLEVPENYLINELFENKNFIYKKPEGIIEKIYSLFYTNINLKYLLNKDEDFFTFYVYDLKNQNIYEKVKDYNKIIKFSSNDQEGNKLSVEQISLIYIPYMNLTIIIKPAFYRKEGNINWLLADLIIKIEDKEYFYNANDFTIFIGALIDDKYKVNFHDYIAKKIALEFKKSNAKSIKAYFEDNYSHFLNKIDKHSSNIKMKIKDLISERRDRLF